MIRPNIPPRLIHDLAATNSGPLLIILGECMATSQLVSVLQKVCWTD